MPHAELRRQLEESVLEGAGHTATALRRAVAGRGGELPEELRLLVDKIDRHAYRVTDEDVAALRQRYSDDQLFEIIVAASVGAAFARLDSALALFEEQP